MEKLTKKYGLLTAICMVVGIVIGSGVFFKAGKVLKNTGGNMGSSLLVVAIVGAIMIICSYVFATLSTKYEKINGVVDYAEAMLGKRFAYYVGWFMTTMYYPIISSTLAWVSAQYTAILLGLGVSSASHLAIAAFYMIMGYGVNALAPKIAGKFQVSTTIIKLIPLFIMGIVGTIIGLVNGTTIESFRVTLDSVGDTAVSNNIFGAIVAFAFAYEGWIIATSINSELKNSKKNLYIALFFGAIIVVGVYMLYFLGLSGVLSTEEIIASGDNLPVEAFSTLFNSPVMGTIVMVFVIISCLGTMNGVMLGCCRGMYSLAARNEGPAPKIFSQIDKKTNMPHNSAIIALVLCGIWLLQWQVFFFDNATGKDTIPAFWCWEADEICIITLYAFYVPIFIAMMVKCKGLNPFKRFVMPALATLCCIFMCYCAYDTYKANNQIWSYLLTFAIIMFIGFLFSLDFKKLLHKWTKGKYTYETEIIAEDIETDTDSVDAPETAIEKNDTGVIEEAIEADADAEMQATGATTAMEIAKISESTDTLSCADTIETSAQVIDLNE